MIGAVRDWFKIEMDGKGCKTWWRLMKFFSWVFENVSLVSKKCFNVKLKKVFLSSNFIILVKCSKIALEGGGLLKDCLKKRKSSFSLEKNSLCVS